jgi:hypothetical protein
MLPREFGGLNLPESIYQMMVEWWPGPRAA